MLRLTGVGIALLVSALLVSPPAGAEIEKVGYPSERGLELCWWPKVVPPKGWVHDRESSFANSVNIMVPSGETFAEAETVMYAKANYQKGDSGYRSVQEMIDQDIRDFRERDPGMAIKEAAPLVTADGKRFRSFTFFPSGKGSWERVCYGLEGDYSLSFVVSSRSRAGLDKAMKDFERMVGSYREGKPSPGR